MQVRTDLRLGQAAFVQTFQQLRLASKPCVRHRQSATDLARGARDHFIPKPVRALRGVGPKLVETGDGGIGTGGTGIVGTDGLNDRPSGREGDAVLGDVGFAHQIGRGFDNASDRAEHAARRLFQIIRQAVPFSEAATEYQGRGEDVHASKGGFAGLLRAAIALLGVD